MKRIVDKEELRVHWQLTGWYEKTIYVVGFITTVVLVVSFVTGFISGLLGS